MNARRFALALAAAAVVPSLVACAASDSDAGQSLGGDTAEVTARPAILALGDSITFGWDPFLEPDPTKVDPDNYPGYAELLGERLKLPVHNASCPGETTGAFLSETAPDNGCRASRAAFGTHHDWTVAGRALDTQMAFVDAYLKRSKPRFITITIGGNDLLLLQAGCQGDIPCITAGLPATLNKIGENLKTIFAGIAASNYKGQIAVLTQYSPHYGDPLNTAALGALREVIRGFVAGERVLHPALGVAVADGYAAFEKAASQSGGDSCKAGLMIKNPDGVTCDTHPSPQGDAVLADAVEEALDR
jgi:lysophospholipase L1-like esterase